MSADGARGSRPGGSLRAAAYALPAVAVLVALLQLFLVSTSDLSRWKGGGFGMYADPHPNSARQAWLEAESPDGTVALRLYPRDDRLAWRAIGSSARRVVRDLERIAREGRNFPSRIDPAGVSGRLRYLRRTDVEGRLGDLLRSGTVHLKFVEVAIGADRSSIAPRVLYDHRLELE